MKYFSVCSGIEAASVAWEPLGWKPAGFSEIEPFPCAVLSHRFPDVKNYGDMTKCHEWEIGNGTAELLVGGTPCQSFSIAGKREGMDDPRGQLAIKFFDIVRKLRPRWIVWENVPGVLSSNQGRDFGAFLSEMGKCGYGFAYRILDAQYFGVPQRRRRVFVVGYLGDWRSAAAILFEPESLRGDFKAGRKTRKGIAQGSTDGIETECRSCGVVWEPDGPMECCPVCGSFQSYIPKSCGTLTDGAHMGGGLNGQDVYTGRIISTPKAFTAAEDGIANEKSHTLDGANGQAVVFHPVRRDGGRLIGKTSPTVEAQWGTGGGNTPIISQIPMQVRRLTLLECERLQGFPDGWTDIPYKGKTAPDGPRYKAIGNSMAVPVMRWIGQRIAKFMEIFP